MLRYTIKRFGYMIFVFFIVSVLQFGIFKMMPGDPVALQLQDRALSMTPEQYAKAYEEQKIRMGLDKSVPEQYLTWMGNTLSGDLGRSFVYRKDVKDLIAAPIVNTVSLNMASLIMVFAISIPLGIATAVRKGSKFDSTVQVGTIIGFSMPSFVIALVMIVLFAVIWPIFPINGVNTPGLTGSSFTMFADKMYHMMLPAIVMTLASIGSITRYVRASMIETLRMDYIRTARSKGLREKVVIYSHAFRNALIPIVTIVTGWFIGVFSGSVVIESIFLWNGIGNILISSLRNQDFYVVLAMNMFYIILSLAANLFLDLIYGLLDPRVKIS